jgi:hypothetical protein
MKTNEILKFKISQSSSSNDLSFKRTVSIINETDITSLLDILIQHEIVF